MANVFDQFDEAKPESNIFDDVEAAQSRSEFGKGLSAGVDSLQGLGYGALGFVGDVVGSDTIRNIGARGMQRNQLEASVNAPRVQSYKDIESAGDLGSYIAYNTGQILPSVAESLGAAALGGMTGGPVGAGLGFVGKSIVKKTLQDKLSDQVKEKALKAAGATALNAYATGVGDIYQETSQGGTVDPNAGLVAAGAVPYAALEYLGDINLARMVGIGKVMDDSTKEISKSLMRTSITKGAQQVGIETGTEMGQEALLTGAAELQDPASMTLDSAIDRIIETGFATAAGTLLPGLGGGAIHHYQNRAQPTAEQPVAEQPATTEQPVTEPPALPSPEFMQGLPEVPVSAYSAPLNEQFDAGQLPPTTTVEEEAAALPKVKLEDVIGGSDTVSAKEKTEFKKLARWINNRIDKVGGMTPAERYEYEARLRKFYDIGVRAGVLAPQLQRETSAAAPTEPGLEFAPEFALEPGPAAANTYQTPQEDVGLDFVPAGQGVLQFAPAAPEPTAQQEPVPGSMAYKLREAQRQKEIDAAYAQVDQAQRVPAAPSEAEQRKAYFSNLAGSLRSIADAGGVPVPSAFVSKLREITSTGTQQEHATALREYAARSRSPDSAMLANKLADTIAPAPVVEQQPAPAPAPAPKPEVTPEAKAAEKAAWEAKKAADAAAREEKRNAVQERSAAPVPVQPEAATGEGVGRQVRNAKKPAEKAGNAQVEQTPKQVVTAWDKTNRSSRSEEWMAGAAESNPAFNAVDAASIPAHGMAKASTLTGAFNSLVDMLTNGIDPKRTLYYDSLTTAKKGNVGAGTGTAGGHAYRDGPFIVTFREGLSGQPTKEDITGVLVNPAHPELVPILQSMFPDLVVRDYNGVADVVAASKLPSPPLAPSTLRGTVPMADLAAQVMAAKKPAATKQEAAKVEAAEKKAAAKAETKQEKAKAAAQVKKDLKVVQKEIAAEEDLAERVLTDEDVLAEADEATSIVDGIESSRGNRLVEFVASAVEFERTAKTQEAKDKVSQALDLIDPAIYRRGKEIATARLAKDEARASDSATVEAYQKATEQERANAKNRAERRAAGEKAGMAEAREAEQQAEEGNDDFFSQADQSGVMTTPEKIMAALKEWFVTAERAAKRLVVVPTWDALPAEVRSAISKNALVRTAQGKYVQAITHKGKVYMIADRIQEGTERAVYMHEMGVHLGLDASTINALAAKIRRWADAEVGSDEHKVYTAAVKRMEFAGELSNDELVAYAVEEATNLGLVPETITRMDAHKHRDPSTVAGMVRQFAKAVLQKMKDVLGFHHANITAKELVSFAYGAADLALDSTVDTGTHASIAAAMDRFQAQFGDRAVELASARTTAEGVTMKEVLGWQTFNHIIKTYSNKLKGLAKLKKASDQRTADISEAAREAGDLDREYSEWAKSEAGRKKVTIDGKSQTQTYNIGALMGETTLEGILPSDDMQIEKHPDYEANKGDAQWVAAYNRIKERWAKLDPAGRAVYTKAHKLHEKMFDQIVEAKTLSILRTLPNRAYREAMEAQIAATGKRPTMDEMRTDLTAEYEGTGKGRKMIKEAKAGKEAREQFEGMMREYGKQSKPYFHVGRFGDYFARVIKHPADGYSVFVTEDGKKSVVQSFPATIQGRDAAQKLADSLRDEGRDVSSNISAAKTEHFERFETMGQMTTQDQELRKLFPESEGFQVVSGMLSSDEAFTGTATARFLTDMLQRIDGYQNMTQDDKAAAKNMIRQLYVQTLPETSSRRVFQHRQGIKGWRPEEMWRSQARRLEIATRQLGYSLHDIDIQNALESLRSDIASLQNTNPKEAAMMQQVVDELAIRERQIRSSPDTPVIDLINNMSFTMYLAASPAYTMINLLQPTVVTLPVLGGKYGFVKSVKALVYGTGIAIKLIREMMGQNLFRPELNLTEMKDGKYVNFKFLSEDDRKALQDMVAAGKIDLTQAHEIGHVARDRNSVHGPLANARHVLGMFMHYSELMNRVATGMAAYKLASASPNTISGMTPVDVAKDMIDQTQYSYELSNRPRRMGKEGVFGKFSPLVFQFQMYNVQTIELLVREFRKAFMGTAMSDAEKTAARKTIAGVFGTTSVVAGTLGAPAATAVAALVNALASDEDEPYDAVQAYRQWLYDVTGSKEIAEMVAHGVFRPTLGIDMSRAGMQNLVPFSRFMADRREWKDAKESLALDLMGPSMGWIGNLFEGYDRMADGDFAAGAAMVLPRFASDMVKSITVAENGWIYDNFGNKVPLDPTSADVAKIAMGFRPAQLAEQREAVYAENTRKMLIGKRKTSLKKTLYKAMDSGDQEGVMEGWRAVDEYNAANPSDMLTRQDVYKGYRQREREYQGGLKVVVPSTGKEARKIGDRYEYLNI